MNQKPFDIQGIMKKNFGTAVEKLQDSYREELARVCDDNKRQYEERVNNSSFFSFYLLFYTTQSLIRAKILILFAGGPAYLIPKIFG